MLTMCSPARLLGVLSPGPLLCERSLCQRVRQTNPPVGPRPKYHSVPWVGVKLLARPVVSRDVPLHGLSTARLCPLAPTRNAFPGWDNARRRSARAQQLTSTTGGGSARRKEALAVGALQMLSGPHPLKCDVRPFELGSPSGGIR